MLVKKSNKVYDPFLKAGLGYQNPKRLKNAIATQPKMYDDERLQSTKFIIDSPDSKETLEDAEESRLKMKNKMIQLDYEKLNAFYDMFVPQQEISIEQTYFSTHSTSNVSSESSIGIALQTYSDHTLLKDRSISVFYDDQDTLRQFYKNGVILMSISLRKCSNEIKQEVTEEVQEMLDMFKSMEKKVESQSQKDKNIRNDIDRLLKISLTREIRDCVLIFVEKQKNEMLMLEKEKIANDSKDIQATMEQRIKILENDFKRAEAQYIKLDLKMQHQKEKMTCDDSWKSLMTKLSNENVQHQREISELIENVNQNTYAYGNVRSQNRDLLMTISELKDKIKTIEKGKDVNTKFDKSVTLGKLLCVTPLNTDTTVTAKKISKTHVKTDKSKPVTSYFTPKNEQRVASSSSVRIPESKDTNLKKIVLLNTKSKSTSTNVKKFSSSVSVVSNKRETLNSIVCQ
ncbi:hypothetical protein Tco_0908279 [Tanacetum coccineum]|uniref:Uncharacterized protein n=1 Tax=Tanacetum coccineum TaxID=301880 RepID=A0ABQ5CT42_9ASTR